MKLKVPSFGSKEKNAKANDNPVLVKEKPEHDGGYYTPINDTPKKQPQVRIAKGVYYKSLIKTAAKIIGFFLILAFVVYLCFAMTIMRVLPATNDLGLVPVKNVTYSGGVAPPGAYLVVNVSEPQGTDTFSHLKQALIPNSNVAMIKVYAGPYGKLNWSPNLLTVDGKLMPVSLTKDPGDFLSGQYLAVCVSGACTPGEGMIVPLNQVYGQPVHPPVVTQ